MGKKVKREDLSGDGAPLTDNPFAALGSLTNAGDLPEGVKNPVDTPAASASCQVEKSRKGGYKLRVEKRGGGKVVTLLEGVQRGGEDLIKTLKQCCATGGKLEGTTLVLQGSHVEKVEAFLKKNT